MARGLLVKQWPGLALLFLLTACMSGGPTPGTVRNTAQTAPADLQLACADAAAKSLGVDSSSVLPVSSSQLDAQKFQVELNASGARANCVIDSTGNVLSVQRA